MSIHWGSNWGYDVPREHERFAHALVDRGIDIVHGHSSHHARPLEIYAGRLILYGCGDFINDYEGIRGYEQFRDDLRPLYFAKLDPATWALRELRIAVLQARALRLRRASQQDVEWFAATLSTESARYGTAFDIDPDGMLVVRPNQDLETFGVRCPRGCLKIGAGTGAWEGRRERMRGMTEIVYVGSYTANAGGQGRGISVFHRDPGSGALTPVGEPAAVDEPSFLALSPRLPVLYAVEERDDGAVRALAIAPDGGLRDLGARPVGGSAPCHLLVTPDASHVIVAHYGSGSVSVHALQDDGSLGERTALVKFEGSGPDPERQAAAHAHHVSLTGDNHVRILDLGSDAIRELILDPTNGRLQPLRVDAYGPAPAPGISPPTPMGGCSYRPGWVLQSLPWRWPPTGR